MNNKVWASVLSSDLLHLRGAIEQLKEAGITALHLDLMDGALVPQIFLGEEFVRRVASEFPEMEIECHLMVCNPLNTVKNLDLSQIKRVIVHHNAHMEELALYLQQFRCGLGVALSPHDDIEGVAVPGSAEKILTMGVTPGVGGQRLLPDTAARLARARERWPDCRHGVDGGVNPHTLAELLAADEFVLGSCLFRDGPSEVLAAISQVLDSWGRRPRDSSYSQP